MENSLQNGIQITDKENASRKRWEKEMEDTTALYLYSTVQSS